MMTVDLKSVTNKLAERRAVKAATFAGAVSTAAPQAPAAAEPGLAPASVSSSAIHPGTLALHFGMSAPTGKEGVMSLDDLKGGFDIDGALSTQKEMSFDDYLSKVANDPLPLRTAHQRVFDMIREAEGRDEDGKFNQPETVEVFGRPVRKYKFFTNPVNPADALLGIEEPLDEIVQHIEQAARGTDARKRMLLLVGGPGSAKSTLVRALKTGYEKYCASPEGAQYTAKFVDIPQEIQDKFSNIVGSEFTDQVRFNPVYLLPKSSREKFQQKLNDRFFDQVGYRLNITQGELPPASQKLFDALLDHEAKALEAEGGDKKQAYENVLNKYVRVQPVKISKAYKSGIATFEAGDPKSIDQTMMTGAPRMKESLKSKEGESDPLAFNFQDGEFFAANGGILEFIEALKLPKELLLKLLSLNEERVAKGDKMPDVFVDEFVVAHTNLPEFEEKDGDPEMAATMKRMKVIRLPYNTDIHREEEIHKRIIEQHAADSGIHVAPHSYRTTAVWAVLSRLLQGANTSVNPLQKAQLYSGERPVQMSETEIRRMIDEGIKNQEGLAGISPRELQQVLPAILTHPMLVDNKSVDGYALVQIIREKLDRGQIKLDSADEKTVMKLLSMAVADLDEHVINDVMEALAGDHDTMNNFFHNYLTNVEAFCNKEEVRDWRMGNKGPDEEFMKAIERQLEPPITNPTLAKEYRNRIMAQIASMRMHGNVSLDVDDVPDLKRAVVKFATTKLKDAVPEDVVLSTRPLSEREEQQRAAVIGNLIDMGYNDATARNALARFSALKKR